MSGRRALVTGANSGIGFATAHGLARLGAQVTLCCRDAARGAAAAEALVTAQPGARVDVARLDVSDLNDVRRFAAALEGAPVHIVVHNAGTMPDTREVTPAGDEVTLATHVLGPHLLTRALAPSLAAAGHARVVWVSSGGMYSRKLRVSDPDITARPYDPLDAYACTKRMQVVLAELWAERLRAQGTVVHAMHPGWADTPAVARFMPKFHKAMAGRLRTPEQGADTVTWVCAAAAPGATTGLFYFDRAPRSTHLLPWTRESSADRDALWAMCEARTQGAPR